MTRSRLLASTLLLAALVIGCTTSDAGNDTGASTSTTTGNATNPNGSQSGSVTSAPGTATDDTVGDSTPTMATASTTTSGTSDGSATTEPCSFLNCDDMNVMNECDTWAQDCPEGQKCTPYIAGGGGGWNVAKCVDVIGTDKPGDECTSEGAASGIDTCIKGVMCWGANIDGGVGTCVAMCSGNPASPVCEAGGCTVGGDGVLHLCLGACDPLLQDCTANGDVCYPINDSFSCAPDASGEEGQANDPCEFINVCDEGLMCAEAESVGAGCVPPATGCCTPFCKFPDDPCPNPDQQCVQYFDPALFPENDPLLDIGVCGVPG